MLAVWLLGGKPGVLGPARRSAEPHTFISLLKPKPAATIC